MSAFQNFLDEKVKKGVAPGLSAVVFDKNGEVFSGTSGVHTVAGEGTEAKPMKPQTIHWVASCTKISISLIVLQILEKGLAKGFSLDSIDDHEALTTVLPEFKLGSDSLVSKIITGYGPVGANGKKELKLQDKTTKVTLRHLLTHTAGLAYYWNHPLMVEYFKASEGEAHATLPFATGDWSDVVAPSVKEAGVEQDYSPVTDWLGQFAIRSTGKNLRQLFLELLVTPLGISNSEFDIIVAKTGNPDVSGVHVRGPGGDQGPDFINIPFGIYQPEDDEPPKGKAHFASACVYASLRAYCKVLHACLVHDSRLLKESTWKLAEEDAWKGKVKMPAKLWTSGRPDLSYDIEEFYPSTKPGQGWGMNMLQTHVALVPTVSGRAPGSYAWAGLCNTYYFVDPVNGIGAMMGTQLLPFADPQMSQVKDEWEALVCAQTAK